MHKKTIKIKPIGKPEGQLKRINEGIIGKPKDPSRDEFGLLSVKDIYLTQSNETAGNKTKILFSNLMVYKAGIDLGKQFFLSTRKSESIFRNECIKNMMDKLINHIKNISLINEIRDISERIEILKDILDDMMEFKIKVRTLYDLGQITVKGFGAIIRKEMNFCSQVRFWMESQKKGLNQALGSGPTSSSEQMNSKD